LKAAPAQLHFILLQGGPSHHDLWDPKPQASAEIRGPFETIDRPNQGFVWASLWSVRPVWAIRLCLVRSMTHQFIQSHCRDIYLPSPARPTSPTRTRAHSDDSPGPGAILNYTWNHLLPVCRGASRLPTWLSIPGPSNRMRGNTAASSKRPRSLPGRRRPKRCQLHAHSPGHFLLEWIQGALYARLQSFCAARLGSSTSGKRVGSSYDRLRHSALRLDCRWTGPASPGPEPGACRSSRQLRTDENRQSLLLPGGSWKQVVQFVAFKRIQPGVGTTAVCSAGTSRYVPPMDQAFGSLVEGSCPARAPR
jgi:hypothetical protein